MNDNVDSRALRDEYLKLAEKAVKLTKGLVKNGATSQHQLMAMNTGEHVFKLLCKQQQLFWLYSRRHMSNKAEDQAEAKRTMATLKRHEKKMAAKLEEQSNRLAKALKPL